ncbi:MAG: MFS transporter [Streptosporangiaceae bacterium]
MASDVQPQNARIWLTFRESSLATKTILAGVFVNRLGGFLTVFLVLYMVAKGYSVEQATTGLGVYGGGAVIGLLIGSMLADRLGARTATVISMAGLGVLTTGLLYLTNYYLLLGALLLNGLVGRIYRPASATLLSDLTSPGRQVMIFAMYRFALNVGATAAPLIGFALYSLGHHQFTLLFWADGMTSAAYAVLAAVALPRREPRAADEKKVQVKASRFVVPRDARYGLYLIGTLLSVAVYVQYQSTLPLDVRAAGVALFWYTLVVAINGGIVISFELLVTKSSQKWPIRLTIASSLLLIGTGVAVYGLPLGPAILIIGTLIWSLGEILGGPATFAYAAMAGPAQQKSRYIGSFQFMFGAGTALGPVAGGVLFSHLGHRVWPLIAIAEVVALAFMATGIRSPRPVASPEAGGALKPSEPTEA